MSKALILKPYERRREPGIFSRIFLGGSLLFLAAFYGLMCGVLPMQVLAVPAVPILIMFGMILWLLPDVEVVKEDLIGSAMVWYVGLNALWPGYVAIDAPGLPWITPTRIAVFGLLAVAMLNYATSAQLRQRIRESLNTLPFANKMFWLFWILTSVSIFMSPQVFVSVSKYANNQIFWTMMFALSAWLSWREGFVLRYCRVLAWTIILVSLLSLYEYRVSSVFWLPWLPSFLKADPAVFAKLAETGARTGTDVYRTRGTFGAALYFAEYLSLTFPFVLHALVRTKRLGDTLLLAAGTFAVMAAIFCTGSRAAMASLILTFLTYGFIAAWRIRLQRPESIAASAALFAYPAFAVVLSLLVVFWRRLHVMVIGGGQHQGSNESRAQQWAMGWPKIGSHPMGYGPSRGSEALGFFNPGSETPTVDSYFLTLLLDYGVLGCVAWVTFFGLVIWAAFTTYKRARTEEMLMLAPMTAALVNFVVVKTASSTEGNLPIAFIILGSIFGLVGRQRRDDAAAEAAAPPPQHRWGGSAARA
ncbi:MAG: O-antigen ligase family protein [Sphingomonas sp.]